MKNLIHKKKQKKNKNKLDDGVGQALEPLI